MRNTRYRQPAWYRYVAGFAGPKPVVVVENPYGGVVPELVANLKVGKGYDRFRMSLYEAAALGANMSVPYGAWLGSIEQDAFYPPHELCVEIQDFLADHEQLFSRAHLARGRRRLQHREQLPARRPARPGRQQPRQLSPATVAIPFWQVCDALCDATQPYDVLFFPDGELRPDTLTAADLRQYRTLILPDCQRPHARPGPAPAGLRRSGRLRPRLGETSQPTSPRRLEPIRRTRKRARRRSRRRLPKSTASAPTGRKLRLEGSAGDLALSVQRVDDGAAIHLIRYDYDEERDAVPTLPKLSLDVRLPGRFERLTTHTPSGDMHGDLTVDGDVHRLVLRDVPLYSVVVLERTG